MHIRTDPDSSLLPATDSYDFNNPDGSRSIVQFENQGSGVYRIQQNTTESDGVLTSVDRDSMSSQTRIRTSGVTSSTSIQRIGDDDFALLVDGNSILNSNINRLVESNVGNGQTVTYRNSTLTILNGDTVNNISMFTYYDGFRFYRFNETKINPLSGNGRLFYSPDTGMAIYSIDPQFTSFLSTMISLLRNGSSTATSPSVPAATTGSVFPTSSTGPQQPVTTGPQQPATTGPQQPATTGPQQPATTGSQQPATTGPQQPATTGPQQPATTGPQQPATTGSQQPATTGPQQPATNPPSIPSTTDEPDVCETRSKSSDRSKTSKTRRRSKSKHRSRSKSKHRSRSHKDVSNECNEETGTDSEVDTPNEGSKSHSPRSRGRKSRGRKSRGSKHPSSSRTSKKTKKSRKPKRKG